MTDEESENELVLFAEKVAADLLLKEPDWDALEKRVKEGLAKVPAEDDSLFAAPLPATVGDVAAAAVKSIRPGSDPAPAVSKLEAAMMESGRGTEGAERAAVEATEAAATSTAADPGAAVTLTEASTKREPVSLADLARAAIAKRGDAETSSIAKESLALASQHRAQGEEIAERVQAASSRQAITIPPARQSAPGDVRILWVGLGIAAVGLAAGFALYLKGETQTVVITQAAPAQAGPIDPRATPEAKGAAASPAGASRPVEDAPRGISPEALAGEVPSRTGATEASAPAAERTAAPAGPAAVGAVAATSGAAKTVRPESVVLEEDGTTTPAAKPAPAPASAPLRPAELNRDSGSADRPSPGAAQAAVGAVLGAARSCLAGHPQPSSATLVFGSNGEVSNVSVGGPAAGTPAAACIQAALKKARVQPFAAPTFSLAVTVRPP